MAFLQVYFNGELKFTAPLQPTITHIGRATDNDVVINNRGVSGHHATIVQESDEFFIVDNKSANGVLLNGYRISQSKLLFGDEITIFKHKLKFIAVDLSAESSTTTVDKNAIIEDQTVMVKTKFRSVLQKPQTQLPYLVQTGGANHGQQWLISKQNFEMGKNRACDLHIGGWFAPQLSAVITRQSDGCYYLIPEKRGKVHINHKPISDSVRLKNNDNLQVRGIDLTFYQPTISQPAIV